MRDFRGASRLARRSGAVYCLPRRPSRLTRLSTEEFMTIHTSSPATQSRRTFLQTSAATLAAGAATLNAHAGGTEILRVGLIGCGGRGTGAASQALTADANVKLVACADAFEDRIGRCLGQLREFGAKVDVPRDRRFVGFNAYKSVIENSDVVLLATPPGFRPMHLKAAVEAGKHVFCEKPMAVDGPG